MAKGVNPEARYTVGGTLPTDSPSYIPRPCDLALLAACRAGEFSYVLSSRQMGKSNLMVRTSEALQAEGVHTVTLDLNNIGSQGVTSEQWYLGVLSEIESVCLPTTDLFSWWAERAELSVAQRFSRYITEVLLTEVEGKIVIFIDEIDSTLGLHYTDDFFAAIRVFYNKRAEEPALARISFVLLGVATPSELIQDTSRTPFNIGTRIEVSDFTPEEAYPLVAALPATMGTTESLLTEILHWTGGQPYLTQKLCQILSRSPASLAERPGHNISEIVASAFLSEQGRSDPHFQFVGNYLTQTPEAEKAELFEVCAKVLRGKSIVCRDASYVHNRLRLSGFMRRKNGQLEIRNLLYKKLFDQAWVRKHRPSFWTEENKRRALLASSFVLGLMVLALIGLYNRSVDLYNRSEKALAALNVEQQNVVAEKEKVEQEKTLAEAARDEAKKAQLEAENAREAEAIAKQEAQKQAEIAQVEADKAKVAQRAARANELITIASNINDNEVTSLLVHQALLTDRNNQTFKNLDENIWLGISNHA